MTPVSRDALLPAIAGGDVQAFAAWLAQAEPRLRSSLKRFARVVDTEAVLQEALLRLWQVAPRVVVDARGDALLRLGIQVAHNLAVDQVRRSRRLEAAEQRSALEAASDVGEPSASPSADPLLREQIRVCIEQLPPQPAQALQCRLANHGCEPDQKLAERLGMQLNTFLKNFGRARQFLLDCLERAGVDLGQTVTGKP